jgi:hypothetical protein
MRSRLWRVLDPLPVLPPNQRTYLGEAEYTVFMNMLIRIHADVISPPKSVFGFGGGVRRTEGV